MRLANSEIHLRVHKAFKESFSISSLLNPKEKPRWDSSISVTFDKKEKN
jgi:hypothetical protein